eukprot:TRINITY_DN31185_c0_g1_i1.p1 TRINITY_DN31185_c0_g1~~TRINITY_DN31185_c0_g1_i1.p1  ORF type:complete len:240 (-),score=24.09 TRINITY_DN31185_c0_g1_i1:209-928(-)
MADPFRMLSAHIRQPVPMHGDGMERGALPAFNKHPFDPRHSTLPIHGVTGGTIWSGMNYDYLPQGMPIVLPVKQPPPGATQGYTGALLAIGTPVRLLNFEHPATERYNGLIGDVVAEEMKEYGDVLYVIRVKIWEAQHYRSARLRDAYDVYQNIPISAHSTRFATANREKMYPETVYPQSRAPPVGYRGDYTEFTPQLAKGEAPKTPIPPFMVLRVPPRNLQPIGHASNAAMHPAERLR